MKLTVWKLLFTSIILLTNGTKVTEKSISTSVVGMLELVQLEADLIDSLNSYADELEAKLKVLKSFVPKLQAESNEAVTQMENYVSNPINSFSLIRRMHEDWHDWKIFMESSIGQSQVAFLNKAKLQFPTKTDLNEASSSIVRLQKMYNLTAKDMARGVLNGKQYEASLTALDTYAMGRYLNKQNRDMAREWFVVTSELLKEQTPLTPLAGEREKVLHLFAQAIFDYEYYSIALSVFDHALLLANKTANPTLLSKRSKFEELARKEAEMVEKPKPKTKPTNYEIGCRGLFVRQSNMKCTYKSKDSPFLRLAPIKMEYLVLDPLVVVFHDVLSSGEIDEMQLITKPFLERTLIQHAFGAHIIQKFRTSKGMWINRNHNNLTLRIARRIMDMVDLDLQGSEPFNVMNYGIGGHYNTHYDYYNNSSVTDNRMATVLFYMTDVEQGGATVFPVLKQAVSPKRGSALFWYNIKHNGNRDPRTLHGGCPVLVGSKWIFTQWINERANMFHRRCRKLEATAA
ncbi:prolyl 4-hydroxylase subunit alpha-2-like isoform X2 [Drosophila hydei]|uniref:procollagen-proline 4-dioxygenase n=1 Tax=Drosophila hydei TaxID=7224 RepID=A0A6J2SSK1_DROHY|nr:prolyl 4-hydroxylase subunit alpha-2-like isoform X2 [Drosophila hydei]